MSAEGGADNDAYPGVPVEIEGFRSSRPSRDRSKLGKTDRVFDLGLRPGTIFLVFLWKNVKNSARSQLEFRPSFDRFAKLLGIQNVCVWVAGGDTVTIAVVIQHSGFFSAPGSLPKYICRPADLSSVSNHPTLTYELASTKAPLSSGTSDSIVFNLQEGRGVLHIISVGSPVLLYKKSGLTFMNEHPRTLIRRSLTMPTQFSA